MSILSWNCQGAGSTEKVDHLRGLRWKLFPNFLFLMETKQQTDYMVGLQKTLGYDQLITVDPVGLSGGLALMWKDSYKVTVLSVDKRIIDVKVLSGQTTSFMSCVYGDHVVARRKAVWDRLVNTGLVRDEAWVLVGDSNELISNKEKSGGAIRSESSFWDFRNMAQNCKLKELRFSGNWFSWGGWREKVWVQCRLDRSFGNNEWFTLFPRANMEYLDMWASDHRPIRISFALDRDCPRRDIFFFNSRMISKPGFEEVVKQSWGDSVNDVSSSMDRIRRCRRRIMNWKYQPNLNSRPDYAT